MVSTVASVKDMAHDSGAARGFDITFPRSQQAARGASLRLFRAGNGMVALARTPVLPEFDLYRRAFRPVKAFKGTVW